MPQNIYDDPEFFANYGRLDRSQGGLDAAPEWPALRAMLPPLEGLRVIDLGCGYGWFCRWARAAGAAQVLGIDVSERMLARARADGADPAIAYRQGDLERLDLPGAAFDLAYSSLAFHYVADLPGLLGTVRDALVRGGALVFSAEHPIYTAPLRPGWSQDGSWLLDNYLVEGPRHVEWLGRTVHKYHRTLSTWLDLLRQAGFAVARIVEWKPTDAEIDAHPDWARELHRPIFLLVSARREAP
jgi:SAM-dependent methyltransferase